MTVINILDTNDTVEGSNSLTLRVRGMIRAWKLLFKCLGVRVRKLQYSKFGKFVAETLWSLSEHEIKTPKLPL